MEAVLISAAAIVALAEVLLLLLIMRVFARCRETLGAGEPSPVASPSLEARLADAERDVAALRGETGRLADAEELRAFSLDTAGRLKELAASFVSLRALSERAARDSQDLREALEATQKQAAADRQESGNVRQSLETGLGQAAERLAGLEAGAARLAEQFTALQSHVETPEREPSAAPQRMEPLAAGEREGGDASAAKQPRRAPRVISAEGRARYHEVLQLFRQGHNATSIAMMTGLDSAEIELMLAGEEPRPEA